MCFIFYLEVKVTNTIHTIPCHGCGIVWYVARKLTRTNQQTAEE